MEFCHVAKSFESMEGIEDGFWEDLEQEVMEVYRGPPKRRADETAPQEIDDIDKDIVGSFNTEDVIETVGRRYAWVKEILNRCTS